MEIRNNLISRVDVNSISKSKKTHRCKIKQHMSYKYLADVITKEESVDGGFINTITNTQFELNEQELLSLCDTTIKYYIEQLSVTPYNNSQFFIPVIELVNNLSNPKLIFTVANSIRYINSTDYSNTTNANIIQNAIYRYVDLVRDQLNYPKKKKLTMVVSCKPVDKTAVYKFQILDVLITKQGNIGIAKMFNDTINAKTQSVYIEKYNDWYFSSSNPDDKRWIIYGIYINEISNGESGTNPLIYEAFSANYTKLPLVLSVNNYDDCGYVKRPYVTPFDHDEYVEENDNSEKIQLFINDPKAKYYDILLTHLPPEYKTNIVLWKELIKSHRFLSSYKLLFREYSNNTPFADQFNGEWKCKDNVERIPSGYYHQICTLNKKFVIELNKFLQDYVEYILYKNDFDIHDCEAAEIIRIMSHGRFYYAPEFKNDKWWEYVSDKVDCASGEVYRWKQCTNLSTITMPIIHGEYRNLIETMKDKLDLVLDEKKSKKAITSLKAYIKKVKSGTYASSINIILPSTVKVTWLNKRIDSYPDVFGALNGIVNLRLGKAPEPEFITGYSKYFITKSTRANYKPFDKNDPTCKIWLDFMKDTTPEKDARMIKWFLYSTGLDQACSVSLMLQIIGNGANGKSAEMDNIMYVLGGAYCAKLNSNLLMGKNKPGSADNDLMQMKNKNIGFICETDQNDVLVASRLKTLAEYVKTGRKNYGDSENFETNCTVIVATNFALNIVDTDHGTFRRTAVYRQKFKYVAKPNPKYPEEKKMDNRFSTLAQDNPEMAAGLLACLVHKRIKFHQKYNSEINLVPSPTIDKYTNEYRIQQNTILSFLSIKLVKLVGHDVNGNIRDDYTENSIAQFYMDNNVNYVEIITLDEIITSYRTWYKNVGILNKNDEIIKNEFVQSSLGKILRLCNKVYELTGYRILESGKRILPGEEYYM